MTMSAQETMEGLRRVLGLANILDNVPNAPVGVVRSVREGDDGEGGDVAVLGFQDLYGPAVLVGTVNPGDDTDTILKLTPEQARAFSLALLDAADESESEGGDQ